jgi:hypothetical protein
VYNYTKDIRRVCAKHRTQKPARFESEAVKALTRSVKKSRRDNFAKQNAGLVSIEYHLDLAEIAEANLAKALQQAKSAQGNMARSPCQRFQKALTDAEDRVFIEQNRLLKAQQKLQTVMSLHINVKVCSLSSILNADPETAVCVQRRLAKARTIKREQAIRFAREEKEDKMPPLED